MTARRRCLSQQRMEFRKVDDADDSVPMVPAWPASKKQLGRSGLPGPLAPTAHLTRDTDPGTVPRNDQEEHAMTERPVDELDHIYRHIVHVLDRGDDDALADLSGTRLRLPHGRIAPIGDRSGIDLAAVRKRVADREGR